MTTGPLDELLAFAALRHQPDTAEPVEVTGDGTERCAHCRRGMASYVRVEAPGWPGQHDLVCVSCIRAGTG